MLTHTRVYVKILLYFSQMMCEVTCRKPTKASELVKWRCNETRTYNSKAHQIR